MSQLSFADVRPSDPPASFEAAEKVSHSRSQLYAAIRDVLEDSRYALTQFDIAHRVMARYPEHNWKEQTIRSACARAGLRLVDKFGGISPDGSRCGTYAVKDVVDIRTDGRI